MEHNLNPEGKQAYEDGRSQGRFLSLAWSRLDKVAPKDIHHPIWVAHPVPECNSYKIHSWLLVWY
jgi:hypothetical protein